MDIRDVQLTNLSRHLLSRRAAERDTAAKGKSGERRKSRRGKDENAGAPAIKECTEGTSTEDASGKTEKGRDPQKMNEPHDIVAPTAGIPSSSSHG